MEPACRAGRGSPYFGNASNVPRRLPTDVSYSSRCRSTQNLDLSPSLGDLGWFCSGELAFTWAMPACFLLLHLALSRNRSNSPSPIAVRLDRNGIISCPLLIASASSILLPIFIWLISHLVKPISVGRYMIPTLIGMACATDHYASYLWSALHVYVRIGLAISTGSEEEQTLDGPFNYQVRAFSEGGRQV